MKKIKTSYAIVLAIVLLFTVVFVFVAPTEVSAAEYTAAGEAQTTMNYNVASTYTVVIPETVEIAANKAGTMTVGVNAGALIEYGKSILVKLTTCDFNISNNDDDLTYTIQDDMDAAVTQGGTVLTHEAGTLEASSEALSVSVTGNAKYSGAYTDSITFTISVE